MRRALVLVLLAATACTQTHVDGPGAARPASCPRAAPDPQRPVVDLSFLTSSNSRVVGHERVAFTPDLPISELVFRLWPNSPRLSHRGGLRVTGSTAAGHTTSSLSIGRTLLSLPIDPQPAGKTITADLDFVLDLPPAGVDRYGHTQLTAWWATGFPLLAWERGRGWTRDAPTDFPSETATSEVFQLRSLTVKAPAGRTVLATGGPALPSAEVGGLRTWRFHAVSVRDVAVAVGRFTLHQDTLAGVRVQFGSASELPDEWAVNRPLIANALRLHIARFGPFPYPGLVVAALPGVGQSGIEYPGVILLGNRRYPLVVPHELAHEWFYGLVGNNQARDPWLDEAFATYAGALATGDAPRYAGALDLPDRVSLPMSDWASRQEAYSNTVYGKGAAALLRARQVSGEAAFDRALRCYVNRYAHRIARPGDLRQALSGLPAAVRVLEEAGALTAGDR